MSGGCGVVQILNKAARNLVEDGGEKIGVRQKRKKGSSVEQNIEKWAIFENLM